MGIFDGIDKIKDKSKAKKLDLTYDQYVEYKGLQSRYQIDLDEYSRYLELKSNNLTSTQLSEYLSKYMKLYDAKRYVELLDAKKSGMTLKQYDEYISRYQQKYSREDYLIFDKARMIGISEEDCDVYLETYRDSYPLEMFKHLKRSVELGLSDEKYKEWYISHRGSWELERYADLCKARAKGLTLDDYDEKREAEKLGYSVERFRAHKLAVSMRMTDEEYEIYQTIKPLLNTQKEYIIDDLRHIRAADRTGFKKIVISPEIKKIPPKAFFECESLEYIDLPNGLEEIEESAFESCSSLKEIIIPGTVKTVSKNAFKGCHQLEKVIMLPGVKFFDIEGWSELESLRTIISSGVAKNFDHLTLNRFFKDPNRIKLKLDLPDDLRKNGILELDDSIIAKSAYSGTDITRLVIPESVKQIDSKAFSDSLVLKEIVFGGKPNTIEPDAFENCPNVEDIVWGQNTIYKIAGKTGFPKVTEITIDESVEFLESDTFKNWGLEKVNYSDRLAEIDFLAFEGCTRINSINDYGKGVVVVNDENWHILKRLVNSENFHTLIFGCSNLKDNLEFIEWIEPQAVLVWDGISVEDYSMVLQACEEMEGLEGVESIQEILAFKSESQGNWNITCKSKSDPHGWRFDSVKDIGQIITSSRKKSEGRMANWKEPEFNCVASPPGLKKLMLPKCIINIDANFLKKSVHLEDLYLSENTLAVDDEAFVNCNKLRTVHIHVDASLELNEKLVSPDTQIKPYGTPAEVPQNLIIDSKVAALPEMLSKRDKLLIRRIEILEDCDTIGENAFSGLLNLSEVVIRGKISTIHDGAFSDCLKLKTMVFPEGLKGIGKGVFARSGLTNIELPDSVEEIGEYAFEDCKKLQEFRIPPSITKINAGTFRNCTSLTKVADLSRIAYVEDYAFLNCSSLQELIFSPEIFSILDAFRGCDSLTKIVIPANMAKLMASLHYCKALKELYLPKQVEVLEINDKDKSFDPSFKIYAYRGSKWRKTNLTRYISFLKNEEYELLLEKEMLAAGFRSGSTEDYMGQNQPYHSESFITPVTKPKRASWSVQSSHRNEPEQLEAILSGAEPDLGDVSHQNPILFYTVTDSDSNLIRYNIDGDSACSPLFVNSTVKKTISNNAFTVRFSKDSNSSMAPQNIIIMLVDDKGNPATKVKKVEFKEIDRCNEIDVTLELNKGVKNGLYTLISAPENPQNGEIFTADPFHVNVTFSMEADFDF